MSRQAESRKGCLQFSLHTLLYLMTFACCAIGIRHERVRREHDISALAEQYRERLSDIEERHRTTEQWWRDNYRSAGWEARPIKSDGQRVVPFLFHAFASQAEKYGAKAVDDETLVVADDWRGGDAGLWHLCAFEHVTKVHIANSRVTCEGLLFLRHLPNLSELQLSLSAADDRCFEHLAHLSRLRVLHLSCPQLTDKGLARLNKLRSLQHLFLRCERVSDAAVAALHGALPRVQIHRLNATEH